MSSKPDMITDGSFSDLLREKQAPPTQLCYHRRCSALASCQSWVKVYTSASLCLWLWIFPDNLWVAEAAQSRGTILFLCIRAAGWAFTLLGCLSSINLRSDYQCICVPGCSALWLGSICNFTCGLFGTAACTVIGIESPPGMEVGHHIHLRERADLRAALSTQAVLAYVSTHWSFAGLYYGFFLLSKKLSMESVIH